LLKGNPKKKRGSNEIPKSRLGSELYTVRSEGRCYREKATRHSSRKISDHS